jgi:hypothetical protein
MSVERGGDTFRMDRTAWYDLDTLPTRVVVLRAVGRGAVRHLAYAVDQEKPVTAFYDSGYLSPECGDDELEVTNVTLAYVGMRPLIVLEETRSGLPCVGQSTRENVTASFFDVRGAFRKVLVLGKSNIDHADPEDGVRGTPTFRHASFFPNSCTNPRSCLYLSVFTASSDRHFRQDVSTYRWNEDTTALVEIPQGR